MILKMIVFINGRLSIQAVAIYLQTALLQKGYLIDAVDKTICISTIVQEFTATIQEYNRTQWYTKFKKAMSIIRIIIAITLLSIGINVLDIGRVIIQKIPITKSLAIYSSKLVKVDNKRIALVQDIFSYYTGFLIQRGEIYQEGNYYYLRRRYLLGRLRGIVIACRLSISVVNLYRALRLVILVILKVLLRVLLKVLPLRN